MNESDLRILIEQGENSSVEFKSGEVRAEALAREFVAFSNSGGGSILLGVDNSGENYGST